MLTGAKKAVLNVLGMRDNSSREHVTEVLARAEGVNEVSVSLIRASAVVLYLPPCEPRELVWALKTAGYGALLEDGEAHSGPGSLDRSSERLLEVPCH